VKTSLLRVSAMLTLVFLTVASSFADDHRDIFVLTSSNNSSGNEVEVFKLSTEGTPSLTWVKALPTGGNGGASWQRRCRAVSRFFWRSD